MFGTLTTLIINVLMKNHLVNLLFEEFKLFELANKLGAIGIDANDLFGNFKIATIVFDMIGIPEDNSAYYSESTSGEFKTIKGQHIKLKAIDEDYCCRDWLDEKLYDVFTEEDNRSVQLSKEGYFLNDIDEKAVKDRLGNYVDWLYSQVNK